MGVDFRHDERDLVVHAEGGGVIDYDGACGGGVWGELFADVATCAEQGDVDAFEGIWGEFLDGDGFAFESDGFASAAGGGEEGKFTDGEGALFETAQHFHADCAGGSDDSDVFELAHGV